MGSIVPTKTIGTSHLAWQDIASAAQVIGSAIDVSTAWAIAFNVQVGRLTGTAFTDGWPNVRIEASGKASGNDKWVPIDILQPDAGSSIAATTLNGAISAAATSCVVTSATNIAAGDLLFLGHTTTPGNYELVRVKSVSGTTITFEEACTYAHDNTAVVTDQAQEWFPVYRVDAYSRIRVVIDNANSGQGIKAEVLYNLMTQLTTA
jgi:hypothetical protein